MERRKFLRATASLPALTLSQRASATEPCSDPKNVILIFADDLNDWTKHLGGHPQARTPNLNQFARTGISFKNAMCHVPWCNPSRVAMFSGMSAKQTGLYDNFTDWKPLGLQTMFHRFAEHGYNLLKVGKVFHTLGYDLPPRNVDGSSGSASVSHT